MTDAPQTFTAAATRRIRDIVRLVEGRPGGAPAPDASPGQLTPDTLFALVPAGGIPARSGTTLGNADCEIYHDAPESFGSTTRVLQPVQVAGVTQSWTVHNARENLIDDGDSDVYVPIARTKHGAWIAVPECPCADCIIYSTTFDSPTAIDDWTIDKPVYVVVDGDVLELRTADITALPNATHPSTPYAVKLTAKIKGTNGARLQFLLSADSDACEALVVEIEFGTNCGQLHIYERVSDSDTLVSHTYYSVGLTSDQWHGITICHDPGEGYVTTTFQFGGSLYATEQTMFTTLCDVTAYAHFGLGTNSVHTGTAYVDDYEVSAAGETWLDEDYPTGVTTVCPICEKTCQILRDAQDPASTTANTCIWDITGTWAPILGGAWSGNGAIEHATEINAEYYKAFLSFSTLDVGETVQLDFDSGTAYVYVTRVGTALVEWSINGLSSTSVSGASGELHVCREPSYIRAEYRSGPYIYRKQKSWTPTDTQPHKVGWSASGGTVTAWGLIVSRHANDDADCEDCRYCDLCDEDHLPPQYLYVDLGSSFLTDVNCDYCDQIAGSWMLERGIGVPCRWGAGYPEVCSAPADCVSDPNCRDIWNFSIVCTFENHPNWPLDTGLRWKVTIFLGQTVFDPACGCDRSGVSAIYYSEYFQTDECDVLPATLDLDSSSINTAGCTGSFPETITLDGSL